LIWRSAGKTEFLRKYPLFRDFSIKKDIRKILDIGCGTGEHAIALAKNGFQVLGLENSPMMFEIAQGKWKQLPKDLRAKVKFIKGDYVKNLEKIKEEYQAAMFMGNALAHLSKTHNEVLKKVKFNFS